MDRLGNAQRNTKSSSFGHESANLMPIPRNSSELPVRRRSGTSQGAQSSAITPNRPRSGCSESLFNFDTPLTPHFNKQSTAADSSGNKNGSTISTNTSSTFFPKGSDELYFARNHESDDCENEILVFTETPNKKLCCTLCNNLFRDPVITTCGHTFCKQCVRKSTSEICPIDGKPSKYIVDNIALSEQIGELFIHCKYGCMKNPSGGGYVVNERACPVTIRLADRYMHERDCEFTPMECPNSSDCASFPKKDLQNHLQTCSSVSCPYRKYGCKFVNTRQNLTMHLETCEFENFKEILQERESTINTLMQENKSIKEDIDYVYKSLRGLTERVDTLEEEKGQLVTHVKTLLTVLDSIRQETQETRKQQDTLMEELDYIKQFGSTGQGFNHMSPYDPDQIIKCKGTFVGHDGPIWCLAVSSDYLFSGSADNTIRVWDTSTNYKCVKTLNGHSGTVLALIVHGNKLYSGSQDTKILVWNIANDFELEATLGAHDKPVCTLAASRSQVFSGSLKSVKVWDLTSENHETKKEITGFNHWVRTLFTTDKELYCGSYQTIQIYCLETLKLITTLKTYGGSVYSICVTDKHIMCGTYERSIHVWDLSTKEQLQTLPGHSGTVYALQWMSSPAGNLLFSASYDRSIRVWSMSNMICKQTLIRHAGSVACLAISKGRLFSGGLDNVVKVWM